MTPANWELIPDVDANAETASSKFNDRNTEARYLVGYRLFARFHAVRGLEPSYVCVLTFTGSYCCLLCYGARTLGKKK